MALKEIAGKPFEAAEPLSAGQIVEKYGVDGNGCRMTSTAGFYAGRMHGESSGLLSTRTFEGIHQGIKQHIGAPAAAAYVNMVADLERATAYGFLNTLNRLQWNGWQNAPHIHEGLTEQQKKDFGPFDPLAVTSEFLLVHRGELDAKHQDMVPELLERTRHKPLTVRQAEDSRPS